MSKVFIVIIFLGGILLWWHWNNTPDPKQKKLLLQKTGIGGLVIVILLLVVTGRMHWLGAVFAGMLAMVRQLLPLIIKYFPLITQAYRSFSPKAKAPNSSTVSSQIIEMTLDHNTGKLSGTVLSGPYKNKIIDQLDNDDLMSLYDYCKSNDMDSARLLESYLAERYGNQKYHSNSEDQVNDAQQSNMSVSEALQILGLENDPSNEEITRAYRKIMQQLHPDRGGNQYFAVKANEARQVLLNKYG